jgi:hypothetical protein
MRVIARLLVASFLAVAAVSFAGCGDDGCSSTIVPGDNCSGNGLHCITGGGFCDCDNGRWGCTEVDDFPFTIRDMATRDLATPDLANPSD